MKFSTRTTYGLRAMIYLAREYKSGQTVSLAQIAKAEKLSGAYLERLFALLKKEKLIIGEKGKSGGYRLSQAPERISVFRVVKALEGDMVPFHCINSKGEIKCVSKKKCGASSVLAGVYAAISRTLEGMRLADIAGQ